MMRNFPPRANEGIDPWEKIEIDPATCRRAEDAAAAAGLSVEAWLERTIRRACPEAFIEMPAAAEPPLAIQTAVIEETIAAWRARVEPALPASETAGEELSEPDTVEPDAAFDDAAIAVAPELAPEIGVVEAAAALEEPAIVSDAEFVLPELPPSLRRRSAGAAEPSLNPVFSTIPSGVTGEDLAPTVIAAEDETTEAELSLPALANRHFALWTQRDDGPPPAEDLHHHDEAQSDDAVASEAAPEAGELIDTTALPAVGRRALRLVGLGAALGLAVAAGALTAQYIAIPGQPGAAATALPPATQAARSDAPAAAELPGSYAAATAASSVAAGPDAPATDTPPSEPEAALPPASELKAAAAPPANVPAETQRSTPPPSAKTAIDSGAAKPAQDNPSPQAASTAPTAPDSAAPAGTAAVPAAPTKAEAALPAKALASDIQPSDPKALAPWLEQRATVGDALAQYRLGILYALGQGVTQDYQHAAQLFKAAADGGVAEAQYNIAVMYSEGLGIAREPKEAVRWYLKAASEGNANAAFNLGVAYSNGVGVDRSMQEAAQWFRRAAAAGIVNAQFNLGLLYERGDGVAQSQTEAYAWYSTAATHGDGGAAQRRDHLASILSPASLKEAETRAQQLQATTRGSAAAPATPLAANAGTAGEGARR